MEKKYKMTILVFIISIFIIGTILLINGFAKNEKLLDLAETTQTASALTKGLKDETQIKQGDLEFSDITVDATAATNYIKGKVTNTGSASITCKLEMKMFEDNKNRMLGVSETAIENLAPNETREFYITIIGDCKTVSKFKIEALGL